MRYDIIDTGYFKIVNITCRILCDTSFFVCKIYNLPYPWHVPTISIPYLGIIAHMAYSGVSFSFNKTNGRINISKERVTSHFALHLGGQKNQAL